MLDNYGYIWVSPECEVEVSMNYLRSISITFACSDSTSSVEFKSLTIEQLQQLKKGTANAVDLILKEEEKKGNLDEKGETKHPEPEHPSK